ncbi:hypothetical protein Vadar_018954 [Vaccinium darrowii]|uniref:Uncharacterized protein n=1 Tax=Vaccinium darrowii TaxID=229202 RepID=A0ACB7XRT2_9ERIC|nr:hypothetical protein Vadar_018954 [Vaccinium darrowii]
MGWKAEYLDAVLVPSGLLIMFFYHLHLLHKHKVDERKHKVDEHSQDSESTTTAMAHDNHYRRRWVVDTLKADVKDRGPAVQVINGNITAAFSLSTISLVVSSLIGTWFGTSNSTVTSTLIYGDTRKSVIAFKNISLLICFLVAFASFLQSARCYIHSSFLITMSKDAAVPIRHVKDAVEYGSNCWSVGMRALYFAITLLLWVFGPIPMFVSSAVMVLVLRKLDWYKPPKKTVPKKTHEIKQHAITCDSTGELKQ